MAHTYRNRHAVPHGYEVRDGGGLFYPSCCPNKIAQWKSWRENYPNRCLCNPQWNEVRFRKGIYHKELKVYRKADFRQYRAKMKNLMRHGRWDDVVPYRRTSGWLTW